MFGHVKLLNLVSAMASHASARHGVIAENIANADTPDYKAQKLESFEAVYARALRTGTNVRALSPQNFTAPALDVNSPNGNSVSLEDQMMQSAQAKNDHDMALSIYKKSLDMLKMSMGKNI